MLQFAHRTSIRARLLALVSLGLAGVVAVAMVATQQIRSSTIEARRASMEKTVDVAFSVLEELQAREDAGELTREQAQARAHDLVSAMTFGEDGYLFAWNDQTFDATVHPASPQLEGKDLAGDDPEPLFRDITAAAATGDGFWAYDFPKPGEDEPSPKLAHARQFEPWDWTLGTGDYIDDIDTAVRADRLALMGIATLVAVVIAAGAFAIARSIARPVRALRDVAARLAEGDVAVEVPSYQSPELGALAAGMGAVTSYVGEVSHAAGRVADGDLTVSVTPRGPRDALAIAFGHMVGGLRDIVTTLRTSSDEVNASAGELDAVTQSVSSTAEETSAQTSQVASAAVELRGAIEEIGSNTSQATAVTADAVIATGLARQRMGEVDTSSREIADVVALISDIAEQTNLLALNATIEAARAGDAGKGFAVVAEEVKALSLQVSSMTERIRNSVGGMGTTVRGAMEAMEDIAGVTDQVKAIAETIAAAVEEQAVITTTIGENADGVAEASSMTASAATETAASASQLAAAASRMEALVARFDLGEAAGPVEERRPAPVG